MNVLHKNIDEERNQVIKVSLSARTLPDIEAAKQILREWMKAHPEEQGMRAGFEQLYKIQENIEEENVRRAAGEVIPPVPSERERILHQAADACTLEEKQWAAYELWEWQRRNPEDAGIREARKGLLDIDDIAEEQQAERGQPKREPVGAAS